MLSFAPKQGSSGTSSLSKTRLEKKLLSAFDLVVNCSAPAGSEAEREAVDQILGLQEGSDSEEADADDDASALRRCLRRHMAEAAGMAMPEMSSAAAKFLQQYFMVCMSPLYGSRLERELNFKLAHLIISL